MFEERLAALEAGMAAVATSSGQAAEFSVITSIASSGDNIISSRHLYGGTYILFKQYLARLGIEVRFADNDDADTLAALIDDRTRAVYLESIGNPSFNVPDFRAIADRVHAQGVPLIVDNTFGMGGYLIRPIEHGADIVIHSATKWIGGHGTTIGGIVVDSGNFCWNNPRFPMFTTPDATGVTFWDRFAPKDSSQRNTVLTNFFREETMYCVGACQNPFGSFLLLQGLETLSLRAERHVQNTQTLAEWLEQHPDVEWVSYPGLESHPCHHNAQKYLKRGFGGVLTFGVKGGLRAAQTFIDSVQLSSQLANVGDAKTLVVHPASTIHSHLSKEEQAKAGVTPDMIRVSVGIEHIEDIKTDFEGALIKAMSLTSGDKE
ncbi:Homocysteine synthase [Dispira parvispora]|uniref:Homocysteine synthase n=1 Tax=Dispira parvispora TaxID=1520584 RepID=A0A9W8ALV7_9FUNG|nr:Homocysteine synthase [Dispira parvispora]